jgi:hypothetical protein
MPFQTVLTLFLVQLLPLVVEAEVTVLPVLEIVVALAVVVAVMNGLMGAVLVVQQFLQHKVMLED